MAETLHRRQLIGRPKGLSRLGPVLTVFVLAGPVLAGLLGTLLPAFGILPALGGVEPSLQPFRDLFATPGIARSASLSLAVGLASGGLSLLVTMLFIAGWSGTRAFARLQRLVSPLLAVPHAAAAFGLAFLIAPSGLLVRLVSPELTGWTSPPDALVVNDPLGLALIAGLVVKEVPFLLLISLAALPQVEAPRSRAVIAGLGYGRVTGFLIAVWPLLYRQIRLGVFAVIAFSTSVVDVAMILGPLNPPMLSVRLVQWMNDPDLSLRFRAAAGALLQLGVTALAIVIWIGLERAMAALRDRLVQSGMRMRSDRAVRVGAAALMTLSALAVMAGLAVLALWSVAGLWTFPEVLPQSLDLRAWSATLPSLWTPLATTLTVALAATVLALALVLACLVHEQRTGRPAGRAAMAIVYLPLIVPQLSFLFGLQFAFLSLGFRPSLTALVLVHLVFVLPYVFLSLSDPWRAFDGRYEQVAAGLGQSRRKVLLRIRLPMLARALLVAAAIGFAVSVGQYLPTVLIGAGRLTTVTTEAVALASGGNRRLIGALSFVQMLLPFLAFAVATLVPALIFRRFRAMRA